MITNDDWKRLIDGLTAATSDGRLAWAEDDPQPNPYAFAKSVAAFFNDGEHRLRARAGSTVYEVTAATGQQAPFRLRVWENEGAKQTKVGEVSSSTIVGNFGLNERLESLYRAAAATIEASADVVNRLLRDIGEA